MSQTLTFSAIICAYTDDRYIDVLNAIDSATNQTVKPHEVVVVIDHNPGLQERVKSARPHCIVVANPNAQGLPQARNKGVATATGDIVGFLDDDAIASSTWIEGLLKYYSDPQVLGSGGSISPKWPTKRPGWFPAEFDWVVGCTYVGMPTGVEPIRNLIGANMSFRRETVLAVGGFREGLGRLLAIPYGCEETDFCIRIYQQYPDAKLMYDPSVRAQHVVSKNRPYWNYFYERCWLEGISKARLSMLVGKDSTSDEWSYTLKTLPVGFFRNIGQGLRGRLNGFGRAYAIFSGLTVTTAGYIYGNKINHAQVKAENPANVPSVA